MKALAVAAGIVFWTLVLGIAWLAFFPGSDSGEPVAILQIEPESAPSEPAAPSDAAPQPPAEATEPQSDTPQAATEGGVELPPGFGVPEQTPQAPMVEPPGSGQQGAPVMPMGPGGQAEAPPAAPDDASPPEGDDQQGAAPNASGMQQAAVDTPTAAMPPPPDPVPETGAIALDPAPVAELVEESQYGPLPKIAADGRRAIDVYSRPSNYAKATPGAPPRVAVLVTGLGLPNGPAADVLKGLPPQISVAYGAYGRSLQDGVSRVRADGHEVLLQIPLEPENYPSTDPGPHTLLTTLPPEDNLKRLQWLMSRYTGYVGVTNHMGAKFEASQGALAPVLEELKRRGLLYVDDAPQVPTAEQTAGQPAGAEAPKGSTAGQIAGAIGLDFSAISVQLDSGNVATQLEQLEAAAKQQGAAIGVAKASSATVKQIADWAGKLEAKGIKLVPVSAAVRSQQQG